MIDSLRDSGGDDVRRMVVVERHLHGELAVVGEAAGEAGVIGSQAQLDI